MTRLKKREAHGLHHTQIYNVWCRMIQRCENPRDKNYPDYGQRGIKVCERWRHSLLAFVADMGPRPDGFTLERINNDGPYDPANCKWASRKEQRANQRPHTKVAPEKYNPGRPITFNGKTQHLTAWGAELGISRQALNYRLNAGWPLADALGQPGNKFLPLAQRRIK